MFLRVAIFTLLIAPFASLLMAEELPWIGVSLDAPSSDDRKSAHLADGVGFLVTKVVAESPLAKAGGQAGDLWWKFDEQILINKRQMYVLLKSKSAGAEVTLQFYRDGVLHSTSLTLSSRSPDVQRSSFASDRFQNARRSRILAKREQVARLHTENETLVLKREGEGWRFEVFENETTILSALVLGGDHRDKLPQRWLESFQILKLTLEQKKAPKDEKPASRVRVTPEATQPKAPSQAG